MITDDERRVRARKRADLRSVTPAGFAAAVFAANELGDVGGMFTEAAS